MRLPICLTWCALLFHAPFTNSQPSSEQHMLDAFRVRKEMAASSLLKAYPVRNIGPTVQGGRIVDIEVNHKDTKEFYVAFASGGIFRTVNNGITFQPVFDNLDALGIGDMALSQSDPDIIYAGTGEKNSSRSSYAGSGVYKTTDGGKQWTPLGLAGTQHISRIVIHPQDNNTVWVASMGGLYSANTDRGVFKSTDGGNTWTKTLYIDDSTGVIDLVINPANPRQLFAAAWQRHRSAWNFSGNGEGSGIYRSDDGGETWQKSGEGFPEGPQVGRIGLALCEGTPNIVYAILDNQAEVEDRTVRKQDPSALKIDDFRTMTKDQLLGLDDKKLDEFLKDNRFPKKYTAQRVKNDIRENRYGTNDIADYFGGDANSSLFNTKVAGAEVYRSDDAGASWKKMNSYDLDGVFYTYGYYFAEMAVAPHDPDLVYIYGVPLLKSRDGGVTWHRLDTLRGVKDIHVDHHALWIDPNDPGHLLLGNDGGLYQSYDEGANWLHINNMPVGQFYSVNVDMEKPYNVYGGLQDNGVLKGSSRSVPNETDHWESIFGGDGMYVAPDPRNSRLVYTGFQFGNYYRLDADEGKQTKITPQHDIGEKPFRWNWRAPLILSTHNPDIVYMAANRVFRSLNQGESWEVISDDLTQDKNRGNVPFSTISALAESPLQFGLLYAGTDDGRLWVTMDGGGSWNAISSGLPADKWVSSVNPSRHDKGTVFVSLNGYREDDFRTYLWMSTDFGKTWKSIRGNLPESVANVVIQDPVNSDLLYCGLDNGTYVSFDKGQAWHLMNNMMNVPAYDMLVHPRDNELVVGTHGRSVFVADVKPLQALKASSLQQPVMAFAPERVRHSDRWGEQPFPWAQPDIPFIDILYFAGKPVQEVGVEIYDEKNILVRKFSFPGSKGFNTVRWDVRVSKPAVAGRSKRKGASPELVYAAKGKYKIRLLSGAESSQVEVEIR